MDTVSFEKHIIKNPVGKIYTRPIFGLGEIYEIMSVERTRKKFVSSYPESTILLSSNSTHSGRGVSLEQMNEYCVTQGIKVIASGYVDCPPWSSAPRHTERGMMKNKPLTSIAKLIFFFLIRLEFLWRNGKNSHMVYCLAKDETLC
jgi:hypothetical protein